MRQRSSEISTGCLDGWDTLTQDQRDGAKLLFEALQTDLGELRSMRHHFKQEGQEVRWLPAPYRFTTDCPDTIPRLRKGLVLIGNLARTPGGSCISINVGNILMGDNFQGIERSTIVNRSKTAHSLNRTDLEDSRKRAVGRPPGRVRRIASWVVDHIFANLVTGVLLAALLAWLRFG